MVGHDKQGAELADRRLRVRLHQRSACVVATVVRPGHIDGMALRDTLDPAASAPANASDPQNPDWLRDEVILALDLYMRHRERPPGKNSPEIVGLSNLLGKLHAALETRARPTLRNTSGVYMKLMNLRSLDPLVRATGRKGLARGSRVQDEVWAEFGDDPTRLRRVAEAIAAQIQAMDQGERAPDALHAPNEISEEYEAPEGRILTRLHQSRERNRILVARKKAAALRRHGKLACEVCAFDFKARYGERGADFIECHHTRPLETLGEGGTTKASDLALLCANCHRMIHSQRPWLTLQALRDLLV